MVTGADTVSDFALCCQSEQDHAAVVWIATDPHGRLTIRTSQTAVLTADQARALAVELTRRAGQVAT